MWTFLPEELYVCTFRYRTLNRREKISYIRANFDNIVIHISELIDYKRDVKHSSFKHHLIGKPYCIHHHWEFRLIVFSWYGHNVELMLNYFALFLINCTAIFDSIHHQQIHMKFSILFTYQIFIPTSISTHLEKRIKFNFNTWKRHGDIHSISLQTTNLSNNQHTPANLSALWRYPTTNVLLLIYLRYERNNLSNNQHTLVTSVNLQEVTS